MLAAVSAGATLGSSGLLVTTLGTLPRGGFVEGMPAALAQTAFTLAEGAADIAERPAGSDDIAAMARLARVLVAPLMLLSTLGASSPAATLAENQRAGGQSEEYFVVFRANDREYSYSTRNMDEYLQLAQGGPWMLTINGFGQITDIRPG